MKNKKDTIKLRDNCILSPNIFKAIRFAIKTHEIYQKQKRKHKDIAYITHPLTVGLILARAGAPENIIIAGILHDTMEDSVIGHKVTRAMLDERFVDSVGNIVEGVTEPNKDLPWKVRKQLALEHIKIINGPTLWVKSADVISNVSELLDDYGHDGDDVFSRFNAPKKDIIANYVAVLRALIERWEEFENPLVADLKALVDDLEGIAIEPTPKPTQCFLWKKEKLVFEDLHYQNFETIETFVDDGHFSRRLMKCKECGQLYFKEFYETTDYIGGNDPQYVTLVPVYSKEDIEKLKATSMFDLLKFRPHISSNFPSDAERPSVCWVGR